MRLSLHNVLKFYIRIQVLDFHKKFLRLLKKPHNPNSVNRKDVKTSLLFTVEIVVTKFDKRRKVSSFFGKFC